jgi:putative PIN family toxin of toxin-antitoxin system
VSEKPRAVIDTQVFLRALINKRSIPAKIVFDLGEKYTLIYSLETRREVEEVFSRESIRRKFPQITDVLVQQVANIFRLSTQVALPAEIPQISRDPKDNIFLACAIAGAANYIVSEDQDLLVLHPFGHIAVIDALTFLRILNPIAP